jgi:glycosyltransferase involved in cell wall biosynthesis
LGERARQIAVERYSWNKIAVRLEQIYEEVAA